MGLSLEVGILADLNENDEEGFDHHRLVFERLNAFLDSNGMARHCEPLDCEVWSGDMLGYSGLHDVRRLAAYLDSNQPLPSPSAGSSPQDACLQAYYSAADGVQPGLLKRIFQRSPQFQRQFDHLILHCDAEGYYLPTEFPDVLMPPDDLEIPGGMVGSAPRLLSELERIAAALEIPGSLNEASVELGEVLQAARHGGKALAALWPRNFWLCHASRRLPTSDCERRGTRIHLMLSG